MVTANCLNAAPVKSTIWFVAYLQCGAARLCFKLSWLTSRVPAVKETVTTMYGSAKLIRERKIILKTDQNQIKEDEKRNAERLNSISVVRFLMSRFSFIFCSLLFDTKGRR